MKRALLSLLVMGMAADGAADEAKATVLFMCPYGGAKSVIAASYFNRAAEAAGLPYTATAVAAETPYDAVPPTVAQLLEDEGIKVREFKPRRVGASDLSSAAKVVSIDCDLSKVEGAEKATIERWDDVPKASVDLPGSAAAIRAHVARLIEQLSARP